MKKEIYIVTDLLKTCNGYEFNAVYAFKSMTSVRTYEKYLAHYGGDHRLSVISASIPSEFNTIEVVTQIHPGEDEIPHLSTRVFDDFEDACEYVADIKDSLPEIQVEHDIVKIHSRFVPDILHSGWKEAVSKWRSLFFITCCKT